MKNYSFELKKKISREMAEVDAENFLLDYQEAYEKHLASDPFELLEYWITYMGVFDGGESRLQYLNPENC